MGAELHLAHVRRGGVLRRLQPEVAEEVVEEEESRATAGAPWSGRALERLRRR